MDWETSLKYYTGHKQREGANLPFNESPPNDDPRLPIIAQGVDRVKQERKPQMSTANDRLLTLLPEIQGLATHYVFRYKPPGVDAEEVTQEACLAYLKRIAEDPDFLNESDADIARRVVLDGWNTFFNQSRRDLRNTEPLELLTAEGESYERNLSDNGNGTKGDCPIPPRPVEDKVIALDQLQRLEQRIAELPEHYQMLCQSLAAGYNKKQAMAHIDSVAQAFSWYRRRLRRHLIPFIA